MSDRHKSKPKAVRMPDGLLARVRGALADGESVNAFIVAAVGERLERREGGSTPSPVVVPRGSTARARGSTATARGATTGALPAAAVRDQPGATARERKPELASCRHRLPSGAWCKSCGTAKA